MKHIHVFADWWFEDTALLQKVEPARALVRKAAEESGVNVIGEEWHQFEPNGYTGMLILSESHVSIHSWAAEGYIALDVFTCIKGASDLMMALLSDAFRPSREKITRVERGGL